MRAHGAGHDRAGGIASAPTGGADLFCGAAEAAREAVVGDATAAGVGMGVRA